MHWFSSNAMIDFGAQALAAVGIPNDTAELTARSLVVADRRGTHSHGMLRLPLYLAAIRQGGIAARPAMRWVAESGATALLDADAALGQLAMQTAIEKASEIARANGAAVVAVQGSSHYGAGAFWAEQLTAQGFLAIVTSTTGPVVAPFGGVSKVFGTNPLTMAAPARTGESLMTDLATSTGAYGKVIAARDAGTQIPEGWAVGPDGAPTTDPLQAMAGAMSPFGGHKGSAVAAAVEAFSAVLGSGTFAFETEDIWDNPASRMNIGHLIIAIDTAAFTGREAAEKRTEELLGAIRNSGPQGGRVRAPGDPERESLADAAGDVALTPSVLAGLRAVATELGLALPGEVSR